ncbi:18273_t:CDS:2 [Acaulospora morrowiae]|uniref:18273_t:CDS:1 n=1 Tax=Acaulospora morrowiae TaxID=94023 RepID=A0A9N9DIB0_9GLOM|nr:18273_t:CDS:2 [Acaulospora morrowiae]
MRQKHIQALSDLNDRITNVNMELNEVEVTISAINKELFELEKKSDSERDDDENDGISIENVSEEQRTLESESLMPTLARLYRKAIHTKVRTKHGNQDEIRYWYHYEKEYENKVRDLKR